MKAAPLLIALAVLAALGGLVWYTEKNPPSKDDETVKIISVEEAGIQEASITKPGKEPLVVRRGDDGKWQFGPSLEVPADDAAIGAMINPAASLNADRVVEENVTDWKPFGLEQGSLTVDLKMKDGSSRRLIFGDDTPTGSGVYARLDGDPRLFTVFSYIKSGFDKTVFDLRDKKLLRLDPDKISRLMVTAGGRTVEFGKTGENAWQILKPKPVRADNFTVGDLVRSVRNAEMLSVLAEGGEKPSDKYRFNRPYATVEAVDEAGVHTLTIAKGSENTYYAKSSDLPGGVYEVSSSMAEGLDKPLADFRNKKLFDFGFNDLSKLDVRDGDKRLTIEKRADDWLLTSEGDRKLEPEKVQTLIDALRGLTSIAFTSDEAGDQKKFGLSSPALEVQVTPAVAGGAEKVFLSSPAQERVYAAREGQPTTYEVEKSAVDEIQRAAEALLEKSDSSSPAGEKKEKPGS